MIIVAPVEFDNGIIFSPNGQPHNWVEVNGYDSRGCRITNIVGHDGHDFLKKCSRYDCGVILKAKDYGPEGRHTNGPRDQSNCVSCRGQYN